MAPKRTQLTRTQFLCQSQISAIIVMVWAVILFLLVAERIPEATLFSVFCVGAAVESLRQEIKNKRP